MAFGILESHDELTVCLLYRSKLFFRYLKLLFLQPFPIQYPSLIENNRALYTVVCNVIISIARVNSCRKRNAQEDVARELSQDEYWSAVITSLANSFISNVQSKPAPTNFSLANLNFHLSSVGCFLNIIPTVKVFVTTEHAAIITQVIDSGATLCYNLR